MKVCVIGIQGKMGQIMAQMCREQGHSVYGMGLIEEADVYMDVMAMPKPDVIVDFSIPQALESYIDYAQSYQIPCVIATTGYTEAQEFKISNLSQSVPVFKSANFSVGVFVLNQLVKQATEKLMHMDVDVYDVHHKFKQDAPSGTAKQLIQTITNQRTLKPETNSMEPRQSEKLYIHVSRQGNVVGEHRIVYSDLSETIELRHAAHSKEVFAKGALLAMNWLIQQKAGLYNMEDLWKSS